MRFKNTRSIAQSFRDSENVGRHFSAGNKV